MTEPPKFDSVTQLVTWMIALTFLAVLGIFTKKLGSSGQRAEPAPPSPERVHVEQASGISTAGVPDETVAFLAQLYAEITKLRANEDRLEQRIRDLKQGVEAGRYPPWPDYTD